MKFFIDSADLNDIRAAHAMGVLDGVTTNPSLMAKVGVPAAQAQAHYKAICDIVEDNVSAEVISTTYDEMIVEGTALANISPKIVVKVPMTEDGIKAIRYFSEQEIRTNCTLVFSVGQAILAAKAGASYVSPFVGRLDDIASDGMALIQDIVQVYGNYGFETEILAASVRHTMHLVECARVGADVVTCPLSVIKTLLNHPLTTSGLAKFLADHQKVNETLETVS